MERNYLQKVSISLATTLIITGCTASIKSTPVVKEDNSGFVYHLRQTEITVTAELELESCTPFKVRSKSLSTSYAVKADTSPSATYTIDTDDLDSISSEIPQADFTRSAGLITAVNYKAVDKTADIITNVVEMISEFTAPNIPDLTSFSGQPKASLVLMENPSVSCSIAIEEVVAEKDLLQNWNKQLLQVKQNELKAFSLVDDYIISQYKEGITELRSQISAQNKLLLELTDPSKITSAQTKIGAYLTQIKQHASAISERKKAILEEITHKTAAIDSAISSNETKIAKLREALTAEVTAKVTPGNTELTQAVPFNLQGIELKNWFNTSEDFLKFKADTNWANKTKLYLSVNCPTDKFTPQEKPEGSKTQSLYYRTPKLCNLTISSSKDNDSALIAESVPLMQYGYVSALTLENGTFEDKEFGLSFDDPLYGLSKLTFVSKSAKGGAATESLSSAVKSLHKTDAEKLEDQSAALITQNAILSSQHGLLEKQLDIVKKQKELTEELKED